MVHLVVNDTKATKVLLLSLNIFFVIYAYFN
jgi:hypothetical protein